MYTPTVGMNSSNASKTCGCAIASLTVVSPTLGNVSEANATASTNGVFYGVISGLARPFRETGIDVREPLPAGAPCCVPRFDGNPERLRIDSDGQPGAPSLDVTTGTVVENLVGPLDYGFQSYTVLPDPAAPARIVSVPAIALPSGAPNDEELSVASINLQRFFDNTDDRSVSDAVLTASAFLARLAKASLYIRRSLQTPDVVAVVEVENLQTLQLLALTVSRDAREAGVEDPGYDAYLEEGNDPGGIDVGALVRRSSSARCSSTGRRERRRPFATRSVRRSYSTIGRLCFLACALPTSATHSCE